MESTFRESSSVANNMQTFPRKSKPTFRNIEATTCYMHTASRITKSTFHKWGPTFRDLSAIVAPRYSADAMTTFIKRGSRWGRAATARDAGEGEIANAQIDFRDALPCDSAELRAFVEAAGLPVDDVQPGAQQYLLAREGKRLVGTVGLEVVGGDALARSLAVAMDRRGEGIGESLLQALAERASSRGIRALYALTTTAERYATARGFERIDRKEVPTGIAGLAQFQSLCPVSAVCLRQWLR